MPYRTTYSPNLVEQAFSEVGIAPVLCRAAFLCKDREAGRPTIHKKWIILPESLMALAGEEPLDRGCANFALRGFSELRPEGVLRSSLSTPTRDASRNVWHTVVQ